MFPAVFRSWVSGLKEGRINKSHVWWHHSSYCIHVCHCLWVTTTVNKTIMFPFEHSWLIWSCVFRLPKLHLFDKTFFFFSLTKGLLGPHQAESERYASRLLFQHLGHLVVSAAYDTLVVDGLDVIPDTHGLQLVYGAAFFYPLREKKEIVTFHNDSQFPPHSLTLMKAYPAPLSVIVRPNASSVFVTSTSLVSPRTWAKMKSSSPICPPSSFCMSTLWELRVQNRI